MERAWGHTIKQNALVQAWLVLLLALCFGMALAAVHINFSGKIAANKRNETFSQIPALVLGTDRAEQMTGMQMHMEIIPGTLEIKKDGKTVHYSIYRVNLEDQLAGWVVKASGQGYADKIELLLGLDPQAETIAGLSILEQKETPGLGNKILLPEWRRQFVHKKTGQSLILTKSRPKGQLPPGNDIDAITGATISSRAVTGIVNGIIGNIENNLAPGNINYREGEL